MIYKWFQLYVDNEFVYNFITDHIYIVRWSHISVKNIFVIFIIFFKIQNNRMVKYHLIITLVLIIQFERVTGLLYALDNRVELLIILCMIIVIKYFWNQWYENYKYLKNVKMLIQKVVRNRFLNIDVINTPDMIHCIFYFFPCLLNKLTYLKTYYFNFIFKSYW